MLDNSHKQRGDLRQNKSEAQKARNTIDKTSQQRIKWVKKRAFILETDEKSQFCIFNLVIVIHAIL